MSIKIIPVKSIFVESIAGITRISEEPEQFRLEWRRTKDDTGVVDTYVVAVRPKDNKVLASYNPRYIATIKWK